MDRLRTDSSTCSISRKDWTPDQILGAISYKAATVRTLERRIKRELDALGDLRPGHLSEQYNVCGTPRCRCKAIPPQKHGPYFQLGWTRKGKSTTRFIRKPHVDAVRAQLQTHEQLLSLVDQWIDAAIELCDLELEQSRDQYSASRGA